MNLNNYKLVLAVTGGGSRIIPNILEAGGASEFFLEAIVPYSNASLEKLVGGLREKSVSDSTARQMAMAAYQRGVDAGETKVIGVGVTCSLAKPNGEREGRKNNFYVAFYSAPYVISGEYIFGIKNRITQEETVTEKVYKLAEIFSYYISELMPESKVFKAFESELLACFPNKEIIDFYKNEINFKVFPLIKYDKTKPVCIYPGSFNPFHDGHQYIFKQCLKLFGPGNVFLEISVKNYEKGWIDAIELRNRSQQFSDNLIISKLPSFIEKALAYTEYFGQPVIFAVGADTFCRIDRWSRDEKFLVFPRDGKNFIDGGKTLSVHKESQNLKEGPQISSSELRKK